MIRGAPAWRGPGAGVSVGFGSGGGAGRILTTLLRRERTLRFTRSEIGPVSASKGTFTCTRPPPPDCALAPAAPAEQPSRATAASAARQRPGVRVSTVGLSFPAYGVS